MDPKSHLAGDLPQYLTFRPHPIYDPVDMEYVLDKLAPNVRNQLVAARLEAAAEVHRAIAAGAAKAAGIIAAANG